MFFSYSYILFNNIFGLVFIKIFYIRFILNVLDNFFKIKLKFKNYYFYILSDESLRCDSQSERSISNKVLGSSITSNENLANGLHGMMTTRTKKKMERSNIILYISN